MLKAPLFKPGSLSFLILIVCLCHLLILAVLGISWKRSSLSVKQQKTLRIQTVSLDKPSSPSIPPPKPPEEMEPQAQVVQEKVQAPQADDAPPPIKQEAPLPKSTKKNTVSTPKLQKKTEPAPKKAAKKSPAKKKTPIVSPKSPVAQAKHTPSKKIDSAEQERQAKLLREAEESIAKISQNSHKSSKKQPLDLPKRIQSLKIDTELSCIKADNDSLEKNSKGLSYQNELALRLKSLLHLPEFGEVKLRLTIKRNGSLAAMTILKSESEKNCKYLEKELKTLRFPDFSSSFDGEAEHSFTITLSNEF